MSVALPEFVDRLVIDGTRVGWHQDRIAAWERGDRIAPVTIDCAMTRACQYACHFCVLPGTEILLASGGTLPIEKVFTQTKVISAEGNERIVASTMSRTYSGKVHRIFAGRTILRVTSDHPVLSQSGYKAASLLEVGEPICLVYVDGAVNRSFERISSIDVIDYSGPVHNLEVERDNSYVANGVGVHNCYAQLQANEPEGKITRQNFFDFLDDAAEIGVKGVSFISDGESTLVPWYADAVEHAAGLGLKVGAGSNGHKLTLEVLERVLPHLAYLRFNFSAGEKQRYSEIMGVPPKFYDDVVQNIRDGMEIINRDTLECTLNMQLVLDPKDGDQLLPFARLVAELRPTYGVIKHCADDSGGTLGVDYSLYAGLKADLEEAEAIGKRAGVRITAKWDKINSGGKRPYTRCLGSPFIMQVSGSGLVANCGFHFNEKFRKFHMGNITSQRFKDIWASDRYKEIMDYLASDQFNPQERCGSLCLQDSVNKFMFEYQEGRISLPIGVAPPHLEFV